jgi:hypothetical protein
MFTIEIFVAHRFLVYSRKCNCSYVLLIFIAHIALFITDCALEVQSCHTGRMKGTCKHSCSNLNREIWARVESARSGVSSRAESQATDQLPQYCLQKGCISSLIAFVSTSGKINAIPPLWSLGSNFANWICWYQEMFLKTGFHSQASLPCSVPYIYRPIYLWDRRNVPSIPLIKSSNSVINDRI